MNEWNVPKWRSIITVVWTLCVCMSRSYALGICLLFLTCLPCGSNNDVILWLLLLCCCCCYLHCRWHNIIVSVGLSEICDLSAKVFTCLLCRISDVYIFLVFLNYCRIYIVGFRMHVFKSGILVVLVAQISLASVVIVKREAPLPSGGYLPPSTSYGVPDLSTNFISQPSSSYNAPSAQAPSSQYGAPSQGGGGSQDGGHSSNGNGLGGGYPSAPSSSYGAPSQGGNGGGFSSGSNG